MMSTLLSLSKDPIWLIADKLSDTDLRSFCQTNKNYYKLCHDKKFWFWRIYNRFGDIEIPDSFREICKNNPKCIWNILTMNTLYMFGSNDEGQLGTGDKLDRSDPTEIRKNVLSVSCGRIHTGIITTDHTLYMFGDNFYGQLGTGDTQNKLLPTEIRKNVLNVSCGGFHTGIITTSHTLYMFGKNDRGQLGTCLLYTSPSPRDRS